MSSRPTAVIIGAGVAGLATAIRLGVQGHQVNVFEKNSYAGGKIAAFNINGYQFDEGPSLFTQPENIEALFELAGKDISHYFNYQALPIACKYFYENGKVVNAYTNVQDFANELALQVGEDAEKVINYMGRSQQVYDDIGKIFLNYSLHTRDVLQAPIGKAMSTVRPALLFNSLNQYNTFCFNRPETVQLFNRYATYNGSDPYQAPAMLSLIPHLEQKLGTYYPKGGMISIANALYQLAVDVGVQFHFNAEVDRILTQQNVATGIVVNGQVYAADVVVSNMDVYFTYKDLLQNPARANKILKQERSSSAIIFYWGIRKKFDQLLLHNIFFSEDYRQEFNHIFKSGSLYGDPTVYVNITSKMEAGHAPAGGENWFVMINAPANTGQDWAALQHQCKAHIIKKLNRLLQVNLPDLIEAEQVMDPVDIERKTSSYMGSLYGTSSNGKMAAFLRHPNFSSTIKGLYFVGGSVHPGGGIPLCLHSAKLAASLIYKNSNKTNFG